MEELYWELPDGFIQVQPLEKGKMGWRLKSGKADFRFTTDDTAFLPYAGESICLLGGRVSMERLENAVLLHACPVKAESGAPVDTLMVHYRFERIAPRALRVSAWFASETPVPAEYLGWMKLRIDKEGLERCRGFDPDYTVRFSEITHRVRLGSGALCGENGYILLSHSGGVNWQPNIGSYEFATNATELAARCGSMSRCDLSALDAAHPLSAVISFGEGEPRLPETADPVIPETAAAEGERYELSSGRLSMAVYARKHGVTLAGIDLNTLRADGRKGYLPFLRLSVRIRKTGEIRHLTSENGWERAAVRAADGILSVYLSNPGSLRLSVSAEARAVEGDGIEWRTYVLNSDPDCTVLQATYPQIGVSAKGDWTLFKPRASGELARNVFSREEKWFGDYPSGFEGVMPVMGIYDAKRDHGNGLYVAVHAGSAARAFMSAQFYRNGTGGFSYDYPAENLGRGANSFALNGYLLVRVLDGDWYDMAEIYERQVKNSDWYRPLGRPDSPKWMREVPMYVMDWMPNDNPDADPVPVSVRPAVEPPRDNWYKKPIELAKRLGLPIGYHLYNWHFIPFNNDYPYYFPVKEGLREGVREMHQWGIHVMPYVNGRIVDTRDTRGENIRFDRDLRAGATKDEDGGLNLETYASHEPDGSLCRLAAMCPSSPVWRDILSEIMRRLFEDYDMDAVYIDQIAAAHSNLCCDPDHGHTPGNGTWWVKAYRELMERLRQEKDPEKGFTTESNAECYADQFDGFLTWAWVYPDMVPFFPKIYAGHIAMLGRNTNGYKKNDPLYFRFHTAQSVMFGQQIGWTNADVVDDPEKIGFLEKMCRLRWDTREWYIQGRMLRPPRVTRGNVIFITDCSMGCEDVEPADAVVASLWERADTRQILLTAANASDVKTQAHLSFRLPAEARISGAETEAYGECRVISLSMDGCVLEMEPQSAVTVRMDRM